MSAHAAVSVTLVVLLSAVCASGLAPDWAAAAARGDLLPGQLNDTAWLPEVGNGLIATRVDSLVLYNSGKHK